MEANDRQQRILNCLLAQRGYIASDDIARQLGVSVRTVYRDIAAINKIATVIRNTPSKGIRLDYRAYLEATSLFQPGTQTGGLTVRERRWAIMLMLLFAAPAGYSISRLSEIFYVAQSSIQHDLKWLAGDVQRFGLRMQPTHAGTVLVGPEWAIRNALMERIGPLLESLGQAASGDLPSSPATLEVLWGQDLLAVDDYVAVQQVIHSVERRFGFQVENPEYQDLIAYLMIVVGRTRFARARAEEGQDSDLLSADEKRTGLAGVPRALMTEIGDRLDLELAESEAGPLRAFLFRSWTNDDGAGAATQVDYASAVAARVIELVSIDVDINLAADPTLHRRLLAHLAPMLIRTEHGIQIQNPVLEGIRTQYPEVHDSVLRAMAVCESEFGIRHINESEAGYLALYLQGALDAQRTLATLRVIAVCSTGRSTAYFLRSRLEQEFPHWEIVDVLGTRELEERMSGEGFTDVDLFVSTVPIPSERVPAAIISPLVTERDLEVIQVAAQQRSGGTK